MLPSTPQSGQQWDAASAFINADHLIAACNAVGIILKERSEETSLYVWQRDGRALYIGKKTTGTTRIALERDLVAQPNVDSLELGFSRAMWRNGASPIEYEFAGVDHKLLAYNVEKSNLHGFEFALTAFQQKEEQYSNADVEKILIRAAVQGGYALYNSSDAGQWESKWEALDEMLGFVTLLQSQGTDYDLTRGLT